MERKSYLVTDGSFVEWKLLYEDLRQSMLLCQVRHEVCLEKKTFLARNCILSRVGYVVIPLLNVVGK